MKRAAAGEPLKVTRAQARRFLLRALGLATPHASVAAALAHHGYVQIDPINVCGRMHDLILRTRVAGYHEGDLMRFLHEPRVEDATGRPAARAAFEHHLPSTHILVALEAEAWPHLRAAMRARARRAGAWSGKLTAREAELAPRVLDALGERGPLGSDAVDDPRRSRRFWGNATLVKTTLQKLFFHGRVLIARRDAAGRRLYDLPERVLAAELLARSEPTAEKTARWEARLKLRQRRLAVLKRAELAAVGDEVRAVRIVDVDAGDAPRRASAATAVSLVYCLREDVEALEQAAEPSPRGAAEAEPLGERPSAMTRCEIGAEPLEAVVEAHPSPRLIAPLDPLIYDRALTRALWDFDYTWEVYTPPARRVRGYYALPLLTRGELAGHVDPKADRKSGRLAVLASEARRGHAAAARAAARELAEFLGLRASPGSGG